MRVFRRQPSIIRPVNPNYSAALIDDPLHFVAEPHVRENARFGWTVPSAGRTNPDVRQPLTTHIRAHLLKNQPWSDITPERFAPIRIWSFPPLPILFPDPLQAGPIPSKDDRHRILERSSEALRHALCEV